MSDTIPNPIIPSEPMRNAVKTSDVNRLAFQFQTIMAETLFVDAGEIMGTGRASFEMARKALATPSVVEEAVKADAWQDIATAPKDGTWCQVWRGSASFGTQEPLVVACWWEDGEVAGWFWPEDIFDPYTQEGRADALALLEEGRYYYSVGFTDWQPLPAPPARSATP